MRAESWVLKQRGVYNGRHPRCSVVQKTLEAGLPGGVLLYDR